MDECSGCVRARRQLAAERELRQGAEQSLLRFQRGEEIESDYVVRADYERDELRRERDEALAYVKAAVQACRNISKLIGGADTWWDDELAAIQALVDR